MALPLYAVTLFISAFLLFLVQPMIGRMILPALGGTPQVWNTCMMFFQTVLLAGYAYTHTISTRLPLRRQLTVHCALIVVPMIILFAFGPFNVTGFEPPQGSNPIFYTLYYLTLVVGLPFFVVSTTAPLLQRWFAYTGHPAGKDPYFLYGASNLGSMLALLAYPFVVERILELHTQAWTWAIGYLALAGFLVVCAKFVWKSPEALKTGLGPEEPSPEMPVPPAPPTPAETTTAVKPGPPPGIARPGKGKKGIKLKPKEPEKAPLRGLAAPLPPRPDVMTPWRRLRWVLLAAAPSSLMLGAITYMSTDLSPMPMFWVLPLALYLLTFILVFARWPVTWTGMPHNIMLFLHPFAVVGLCLMLVGVGAEKMITVSGAGVGTTSGLTLLVFFLTAMACHGELARDRPSTKHLTEFFLWMSVGGMIGGVFNALFAPLLFTGVVEYPLALVVSCFMRPEQKVGGWADDFFANAFTGLTTWFSDLGKRLSEVPLITFMVIGVLGAAILGGSVYLLNDLMEAERYSFMYWLGLALYWLALLAVIMFFAIRFRPQQGLSFFLDGFFPLLLFTLCAIFVYNGSTTWGWLTSDDPKDNLILRLMKTLSINLTTENLYKVLNLVMFVIPLFIGLFWSSRPLRYGLAVAAVIMANAYFNPNQRENALFAGRTYFGVLRVYERIESLSPEEVEELKVSPDELKQITRKTPDGLVYVAPYRMMMHGTTHHGLNYQLPKGLRRLATTYYHSKGPTGIIMEKLKGFEDFKDYQGKGEKQNEYHSDAVLPASLIGMGLPGGGANLPLDQLISVWTVQPYATVGLGTGTMASYGRPFQHVTFYEIDEVVRSFHVPPYAPDQGHGPGPFFNYTGDAIKRGVGLEIIMGDARQSMKHHHQGTMYLKGKKENDIIKTTMNPNREKYYRAIELDAFSSDAIPVHLITLESVQMYFDMMSEQGVLCVHTSNRHADLTIPARDIALKMDAEARSRGEPGYFYRVGKDNGSQRGRRAKNYSIYRGHFGQEYVMIARKDRKGGESYLPKDGDVVCPENGQAYLTWYSTLPQDDRDPYTGEPDPHHEPVWTDDFTNLVGILRKENTLLGRMPPVRFILIMGTLILIVGIGLIILVTKNYENKQK